LVIKIDKIDNNNTNKVNTFTLL